MINLENFFEIFSERFQSENDISDITYILMKLDETFKKIFLEYIFNDINVKKITFMQREFYKDNSRPDFILETESAKYLIEIKKWDKNHHFEQYKTNFPKYERAYITNYELSNDEKKDYKDDYKFLTWKNIHDNLCNGNKNLDNEIIKGYTKYLQSVCNFMEIKDMRFKNLSNLAQFNGYVKELVDNTYENYTVKPYNTKYNYGDTFSGSYFSLQNGENENRIYPWFGVCYGTENTSISFILEFFKGWCDILANEKDNIVNEIQSCSDILKYNSNTTKEIAIEMSDDCYNKFYKEEDVGKQKEILKDFFDTCITIVGKYL